MRSRAAVVAAAALASHVASAQPGSQFGSMGKEVQMNFGSDSSGAGEDGSAGSGTWYPLPTTSSADWNIDWRWNRSSSSSSSSSASGSGSWFDYEDEAGVEVVYPNLDGAIDAIRRRTYYFDKSRGFEVRATDAWGNGLKYECSFPYCIRLTFETDYGAMSPFDAFVLDRYESVRGPVVIEKDLWEDRPLPLVLGRLSDETRAKLGNWSDAFGWNDSRRTTWVLSPLYGRPEEIDVTLSLKQLYTLLPGYNGTDLSSNGPFYSADLTDQVIIRVTGQVASPFAGTGAMLPIVVNHTGSRLIDVNLTTTLLYEGEGVNGGNEIELKFTLSRRKYGGMMPWFPARPSRECGVCEVDKNLPRAFQECLDAQLQNQSLVFEDLLSFKNDRYSFDIEPFAETCFNAIASGEWVNGTNTTAPMRLWDGVQWITPAPADPAGTEKRWEILQQTDVALRCWAETQCPLGGTAAKSDAEVVVLRHVPASTEIQFNQPDYNFYLQLGLEEAGKDEIITTAVITNDASPQDIETAIERAFPNADKLSLDVEVRVYNNTAEIRRLNKLNRQLLDNYNRALEWTGASASSDSSAGSNDSSSGNDGSRDSGSSASESSSQSRWGSDAGSIKPQPPKLFELPPETYTIEIISHNVTVVPHVVSVFSNDNNVSYHSIDNSLRFEVAPLDVNKFEYVPPPPYVDLNWEEEPAWISDVRRHIPQFAWNDSCGRCLPQYEACLFDFDCAFGVNVYAADAFSRERLVNETWSRWNGDGKYEYEIQLNNAVRSAKPFFPRNGFSKFQDLLVCWAEQQCDLDEQRPIYYKSKELVQAATPTVLSYTDAELLLFVDENETVTFINGGRSFNTTVSRSTQQLADFLRWEVYAGNPAWQDVQVEAEFADFFGARKLRVSVSPPDMLWNGDDVWGRAQNPQSGITFTPWSLSIEANRSDVVDETDGWRAIQWPRLEEWFRVFRYVPASSYPGWSTNNTQWNNTNGTSGDWTPVPPPPTPPSAFYAQCANVLTPCTQDAACLKAVSDWLPGVLPKFSNLYPDWDGIYRIHWNTTGLNLYGGATATAPNLGPYKTQVLNFLSCVAKFGYAVGYAHGDNNTFVPTTLHFQSSRVVYLVDSSPGISLQYTGLPEQFFPFQANYSSYLDLVQYHYGEIITTRSWREDKLGVFGYAFTGSFQGINQLSIGGLTSPSLGPSLNYYLWFESRSPTWEYLQSWYSPAPPKRDNATSCSTCLPKLQACYNDTECWRGVQDTVVPILKQQNGAIPSFVSSEGDGVFVYKADLGWMLRDRVVNVPAALKTTFQTATSWQLFTDVLLCLSAVSCDVENMDSALEPPATAHVPSYLRFQPASAELFLYEDAMVEVTINGVTFSYLELATGTSDGLFSFLQTALQPHGVPFDVMLLDSDKANNAFNYSVSFGDAYFGVLPEVMLVNNGIVATSQPPLARLTSWQLTIDSTNQMPQWDKLTSALSEGPALNGTTSTVGYSFASCDYAETLRRVCYNSYDCQSLLSTALAHMRDELQTMATHFNDDKRVFVANLRGLLTSQVFPFAASDDAIHKLMDVLRESARCASNSAPSTTAATPLFQDMKISFLRPATGTVLLMYLGGTFEYPEEAPGEDRTNGFGQFVYDHVVAQSGDGAGIMHWFGAMDNGVMKHDFEFPRVYAVAPLHLHAADPVTGGFVGSDDWAWELSFQSPTYTLDNAFAPWLDWLSTRP